MSEPRASDASDEALLAARRDFAERPHDPEVRRALAAVLHARLTQRHPAGPPFDDAGAEHLREMADLLRAECDATPQDPDAAALLAGTRVLAGIDLLQRRKLPDEAAVLFGEAVALLRPLVAEHPGDADHRESLADALSWAQRAEEARRGPGDRAAERRLLAEAAAHRRVLVASRPRSRDRRRCLAEVLETLVVLERLDGDLVASDRCAEEAVGLRRDLCIGARDRVRPKRDLRWALEARALTLDLTERSDDLVAVRKEKVALSRELAALPSADDDDREDLSRDLLALGEALRPCGALADACAAFAESAHVRRGLLAARPDDAGLLNGLVLALAELRDAQSEAGAGAEALATAQDVVVLSRRQAEIEPHERALVRELGVDLDTLGDLLRDAPCDVPGSAVASEAADRAYAEAETVFRGLVAADPSQARERDDLAIAISRRGRIRLDRGDALGALQRFEEAVAILRGLRADQPERARWTMLLGLRLADVGEARGDAGDGEGALAAYEEAVSLLGTTIGAEDGCSAEDLRDVLERAADAASAAGRPDRATALRAQAAGLEVGAAPE